MSTKKNRISDSMKLLNKLIGSKMTFGDTLEAIRLADGLSQSLFAKKLKISQAHLSQIEKGTKLVSPERARKFAKVLGYSEITFIELSLQDQLQKSGIKMKIHLEPA